MSNDEKDKLLSIVHNRLGGDNAMNFITTLASAWNELSESSKADIAFCSVGKYQGSKFITYMNELSKRSK